MSLSEAESELTVDHIVLEQEKDVKDALVSVRFVVEMDLGVLDAYLHESVADNLARALNQQDEKYLTREQFLALLQPYLHRPPRSNRSRSLTHSVDLSDEVRSFFSYSHPKHLTPLQIYLEKIPQLTRIHQRRGENENSPGEDSLIARKASANLSPLSLSDKRFACTIQELPEPSLNAFASSLVDGILSSVQMNADLEQDEMTEILVPLEELSPLPIDCRPSQETSPFDLPTSKSADGFVVSKKASTVSVISEIIKRNADLEKSSLTGSVSSSLEKEESLDMDVQESCSLDLPDPLSRPRSRMDFVERTDANDGRPSTLSLESAEMEVLQKDPEIKPTVFRVPSFLIEQTETPMGESEMYGEPRTKEEEEEVMADGGDEPIGDVVESGKEGDGMGEGKEGGEERVEKGGRRSSCARKTSRSDAVDLEDDEEMPLEGRPTLLKMGVVTLADELAVSLESSPSLRSETMSPMEERYPYRAENCSPIPDMYDPPSATIIKDMRTPDRIFKVVFVGDSAVGKTCFLHRFCHNRFRPLFNATIGVDFTVKTIQVPPSSLDFLIPMKPFWFRSITKQYFRKADGVVLMYDVTSEQSFLHVRNWIDSVKQGVDESTVMCLVGNKEFNMLFFETSAFTGYGISECMLAMAERLQKREENHLEEALKLEMNVEGKKRSWCCV